MSLMGRSGSVIDIRTWILQAYATSADPFFLVSHDGSRAHGATRATACGSRVDGACLRGSTEPRAVHGGIPEVFWGLFGTILFTLLRSYVPTYLFTYPYFRDSRQRSGHALKSAAAPRVLFGGEVLTGPGKDPGEFRKGAGLVRRGPMSCVFWFVTLWARAEVGCCA